MGQCYDIVINFYRRIYCLQSVVGVRRDAKKTCSCRKHGLRCSQMCSCHGCPNVEETIIDDITDIGINDDTQDEELLFENMMQMPMQDGSQHVDEEEDEETEEEEEHATQIHTDARHTKKR